MLANITDPAAFIAGLTPEQKAELDKIIAVELKAKWLPDPRNEPQMAAYCSKADLLLFGGAAGGGKSDLLCGTALNDHQHSVIFRRQSIDLRGIENRILQLHGSRDGWNGADKILRTGNKILELGHLEKPGAELSWQGRPHDFIGFDEGAQLSRAKAQFVLGWLRSVNPKQRRRAIIASNPPTGGEGEWLIEWFAPWLDEKFSNPAKQGELRYAVTAPDRDGTTIWVPDARPIIFTEERAYRYATDDEISDVTNDQVVTPLTRTFILSLLRNNPHLANTGYRAQLQSLPEPLRSQLLNGSFTAGRADHEWQVIPTEWVKAAQARWTPRPPEDAMMSAIGVDVAQGGVDDSTAAPRYGSWYAPLIVRPGSETPKPSDVAGMVVAIRRDGAIPIVDVGGGYGGGVKERLEDNEIKVIAFNGANESTARTADKQLYFVNRRAEAMWRFREALDPDQEGGSKIALPPDPRLLADLTAPRWRLMSGGILIESKEELKKPERLGRSPDRGDAVIMAWSEGEKAIMARQKRGRLAPPVAKLPSFSTPMGHDHGTGWMGRR